MPHKLRKGRKKRGSRTVGWGRVGQHRKTGQKGGRKVGRRKHLWSYVLRHEPDYFRKKGFHPQTSAARVVNVGELEDLAAKLTSEPPRKAGAAFLDLEQLGYNKLLGFGRVSRPFAVKVESYSELAARKLKEAGGELITGKPE